LPDVDGTKMGGMGIPEKVYFLAIFKVTGLASKPASGWKGASKIINT
jgi:hypothetical protein